MGISSAFQKKKEDQSIFPVFAIFKCLYLKIVNMPEQHILGWRARKLLHNAVYRKAASGGS